MKKSKRNQTHSHTLLYVFVTSFALKGFNLKQIAGMLLYLALAVHVMKAVNKIVKTFKGIFLNYGNATQNEQVKA